MLVGFSITKRSFQYCLQSRKKLLGSFSVRKEPSYYCSTRKVAGWLQYKNERLPTLPTLKGKLLAGFNINKRLPKLPVP